MSTLIALCTALQCTPNDLLEVDTTPVEQPTPNTRPVTAEPPKAVGDGRRSMPPV
jgi:hypothetical protein